MKKMLGVLNMASDQSFRATPRERRLYGFVDAVIPPRSESRFGRQILLLDCVDANAFDEDAVSTLMHPANLSLVRTLSTVRRWRDDFSLNSVEEGDWVELALTRNRTCPRAWELPATNNFEATDPVNLSWIRRLRRAGGHGPTPTETDLPPNAPAWLRLRHFCRLANPIAMDEAEVVRRLTMAVSAPNVEVRVLDVGQASCVAVLQNGRACMYFDVGAPMYRNGKLPRGFELPEGGELVVLSHWDCEHFSLARRYPELKDLIWLAPDQPVGPNALRFQAELGSNLRFVNSSIEVHGIFALLRGTVPSPRNRDGNGFGLRLMLGDEVVVLSGDLDYRNCPPGLFDGVTAMTVPNHGGRRVGPLPVAAHARPRAVASYGRPNCSGQPDDGHLQDLSADGWKVEHTAWHQRIPRSWRCLYNT